MITCTALRRALLEWQRSKGVHQKASKSKLKADGPDGSNYFNHKNDGGKNASCCTATGRKLLTSPGVADMYTFLMNTWNTIPESYERRVYRNTLPTVKLQIQHVQNPTPAMAISMEHQQNVIYSLGASRRVREDVECKLRCVNFRRLSDHRRAFRQAFGVTGISNDWLSCTMAVIVISLRIPGGAGDKSGSADDMPGST